MNCYINENFKQVSILRKLLLDNINIIVDTNGLILNENDFFVSDSVVSYENAYSRENLNYDDIIKYFSSYMLKRYYANYDYYYLLNAFEDIFNSDIDTIAVGSSYSLFGLDDAATKVKAKNLSLASQDFYYGCKIAEKVINKTENIKNIILGAGYYSFFSDLSKTQDEDEISRLSKVYYPILADYHNAYLIPESKDIIKSDIFDIKRIEAIFSRTYYDMNNGNYFNNNSKRFNSKSCLWANPSQEWKDISLEEKIKACEVRTSFHNKAIKYTKSYVENIEVLKRFVRICNEKIFLYIF